MRLSRKLAVSAAIAVGLVYFGGANAEEKKPLEIKACMKCQNSVRNSILPKKKTVEVDWTAAAEKTKTWLAAAGDLAKNKPPLGDEASWKEQTTKYQTNVKAVDDAVGKKDVDAVTKALATFGTSCGGCHSKHKPK
ncbi:MAG TPA: hypothetical protein VKD90_30050 [Gemmataceae bacterium]|nr:hypothetical protein [Gemmataceae bacterium]